MKNYNHSIKGWLTFFSRESDMVKMVFEKGQWHRKWRLGCRRKILRYWVSKLTSASLNICDEIRLFNKVTNKLDQDTKIQKNHTLI